jgi:hypothetical protein
LFRATLNAAALLRFVELTAFAARGCVGFDVYGCLYLLALLAEHGYFGPERLHFLQQLS